MEYGRLDAPFPQLKIKGERLRNNLEALVLFFCTEIEMVHAQTHLASLTGVVFD